MGTNSDMNNNHHNHVLIDIHSSLLTSTSSNFFFFFFFFSTLIGSWKGNTVLYPKLLLEFARVLKEGTGRLIILTADKKLLLQSISTFGRRVNQTQTRDNKNNNNNNNNSNNNNNKNSDTLVDKNTEEALSTTDITNEEDMIEEITDNPSNTNTNTDNNNNTNKSDRTRRERKKNWKIEKIYTINQGGLDSFIFHMILHHRPTLSSPPIDNNESNSPAKRKMEEIDKTKNKNPIKEDDNTNNTEDSNTGKKKRLNNRCVECLYE